MTQNRSISNLRKAGIASVALAASLGLTSFTMDKLASETGGIQFPRKLDKEQIFRLSSINLSRIPEGHYQTIDEIVFDDAPILEASLQREVDATMKGWLTYYEKDIRAQIKDITQYDDFITLGSIKFRLPKSRLYSLIRNESLGIRTKVSPQGAGGLTQLMPDVAKIDFNLPLNKYVDYRFFPRENLRAGFEHFSYMFNYFKHNWILAYIGYNAGRSIGEKYVGKSWEKIKAGLLISEREETVDYIVNNLAFNAILLNPASFDVMIEKKSLLSQNTIEHQIKPHETIRSIMKDFNVSYTDLEYYNKNTHKAFDIKPNVGLKEGYILLIPKKQ